MPPEMVYKTDNFKHNPIQFKIYQHCAARMTSEPNNSTNWADEDDDDVILHNTQYFCLLTDTTGSYDAPTTGLDSSERRTQDIMKKLKERLLKHLTDNHRAAEHFKSLKDMRSTPDGLRVKIKPHGALVETPQFKEKWQEATKQCEQILIDTLKEHLTWAQTETKKRFNMDQKTALHQLKDNKVTNEKALELVKRAAEESHQQRVQLSEMAQKKKTEKRAEKRRNTDREERDKKRYRQ